MFFLSNRSDVTATLDGLDLVAGIGRIHVLGTYVVEAAPCRPGNVTLPTLGRDACAYPLAGSRVAPMGSGGSVTLAAMIRMDSPGVYRSGWFRIRYHVGPLPFQIFRTDELAVCAPEPGKRGCPASGI